MTLETRIATVIGSATRTYTILDDGEQLVATVTARYPASTITYEDDDTDVITPSLAEHLGHALINAAHFTYEGPCPNQP